LTRCKLFIPIDTVRGNKSLSRLLLQIHWFGVWWFWEISLTFFFTKKKNRTAQKAYLSRQRILVSFSHPIPRPGESHRGFHWSFLDDSLCFDFVLYCLSLSWFVTLFKYSSLYCDFRQKLSGSNASSK
jgi:hypothetical protein